MTKNYSQNKYFFIGLGLTVILHALVLSLLYFFDTPTEKVEFKPLAVMEFAHYNPLGGDEPAPNNDINEALKVEDSQPEILPEPEVTPEPEVKEETPQVIESSSEKAAPAVIKKEKPKKVQKDIPKKTSTAKTTKTQNNNKQVTNANSSIKTGENGTNPTAKGGKGQNQENGNPKALNAYKAHIARKLERFKKYPPAARKNRQEGLVTVSFTVDNQGKASNIKIIKSSGHPILDEEVLALVRRVSPFNKMPKDMPQSTININAPLKFNLK